ncbi:MAG: transposase [Bacteroidia bacterium]|nr:transposase [Bacteroidia bacterium]
MDNEKKSRTREVHRRYYAKVTRMYYEDRLTHRRISQLIPVSLATVQRWCATFASENGVVIEKQVIMLTQKPKLAKPIAQPNDVKSLQAEVARLQKALKDEKLRADAYDKMIDIAETNFKIPIRKKAGAKR